MKTKKRVMKKSIINLMLSVALLLPLSSFAADIDVVEKRQHQGFTGLEVSSVFEVYLTQGDGFSVEVEAPEEHLEYIDTYVEGKTLVVDYSRRARNLRGLELYVTAPVFEYIHAGGASTVKSVNRLSGSSLELKVTGGSRMEIELETESLVTNISGAGSIRLSGIATTHKLSASGVSDVRAYDLETNTTNVNSSGTASVRITVLGALYADASGTSGIIVRGNPDVANYNTSVTASIRGVDDTTRVERRVEQDTEQDTLVVSIGRREVVITEGTRPHIRHQTRMPWQNNWSGFYLGVNGYLTHDDKTSLSPEYSFMDLEYNNSLQVNLNFCEQNVTLIRGGSGMLGLVSGLGVSWNNYRFSENIRLVKGEQELEYYFDDQFTFRKNKLTVSHLNLPIMMEFQKRPHSGSRFHMAAGLNVGLRLRSHTKQVYNDNGERQKDKEFTDFHLAPFRYEAIARIGWGSINLFATYSLSPMFKDERGPELYPFSVGLRLLNF